MTVGYILASGNLDVRLGPMGVDQADPAPIQWIARGCDCCTGSCLVANDQRKRQKGTGKPRLIQQIDARGAHPRTFSIDASGHVLVAAGLGPMALREDGRNRVLPAGLSVFRVEHGPPNSRYIVVPK